MTVIATPGEQTPVAPGAVSLIAGNAVALVVVLAFGLDLGQMMMLLATEVGALSWAARPRLLMRLLLFPFSLIYLVAGLAFAHWTPLTAWIVPLSMVATIVGVAWSARRIRPIPLAPPGVMVLRFLIALVAFVALMASSFHDDMVDDGWTDAMTRSASGAEWIPAKLADHLGLDIGTLLGAALVLLQGASQLALLLWPVTERLTFGRHEAS